MKTETEFRKLIVDADWLNAHVKTIALVVAGIRRIMYRNEPHNIASSYDNYYIDGETVTAYFSEAVMGSANNESLDFPVSYLWDPDYLATETTAYAERNRLADEKMKAAERTATAVLELNEREEYIRLHAKYGTTFASPSKKD